MVTIKLSEKRAKKLLNYVMTVSEHILERREQLTEIIDHLDNLKIDSTDSKTGYKNLEIELRMFWDVMEQIAKQVKLKRK